MGTCFSCRSSSSSSESDQFNGVRVVHLNGYVEDFDHPVSVRHVAGQPGKQFVCTAAQLLSAGSNSMRPEDELEPGRVYFLLPQSALHGDTSPLDLAAVARKLTAVAKASRYSGPTKSSVRGSPGRVGVDGSGRVRSWKPNLESIRERSFHRRNESELHIEDCHSGDLKI